VTNLGTKSCASTFEKSKLTEVQEVMHRTLFVKITWSCMPRTATVSVEEFALKAANSFDKMLQHWPCNGCLQI
jgi:hypothetical protein